MLAQNAGLIYYLVAAGHANHQRADARVFQTPHLALSRLRDDLSDPVRRYDLERRGENILKPHAGIRYRTDNPHAAHDYYKDAVFDVWGIAELERRKDRFGTAFERRR